VERRGTRGSHREAREKKNVEREEMVFETRE
jgi:hypothetical protein